MAATTIGEIRKDPIIRAALSLVETSETALNLERIDREVDVLQNSRTSRKLYKLALEPTSLAEAALRDLSNRARLSELKTSVYRQQASLETAFDAAAAHLTTKHRSLIQAVASNATDRKYVINKILKPLRTRIAELECGLEIIDIAIKDLDQAGFLLRNATEMMKLLIERRSQVV